MPALPRVYLSTWPTPLERAPRLAAALGLGADDLWIKRDDLTGLAGGGNKLRKLEYTCAAAQASGARTLVTVGVAQSNHARLTSAAAAYLGLDCVLVLAGNEPSHYTGNLALNGMLGTRMVWAGDVDDTALNDLAMEEVHRLQQQGTAAALIPFGGSTGSAVHGYLNCGEELKAQLPNLRQVFTAVGSGGTMAGLVQSLGADRVTGVDSGAVDDAEARVRSLIASFTGNPCGADLQIRGDQVGPGYEHLTQPVREALKLFASNTGIVLDPIYTGRAFAGLLATVQDGSIKRGEQTVFLHSGGLPGFFGNPEVLAFSKK